MIVMDNVEFTRLGVVGYVALLWLGLCASIDEISICCRRLMEFVVAVDGTDRYNNISFSRKLKLRLVN